MAALVCDICGGKLVMQSGGVTKCDSCGMEYTKERIQEKIQEIKGTVKIDGPVETVKGDAEKERLIKTAQNCFRKGAFDEGNKMFEKISEDYPNEWRAWMGIIYCKTSSLTDNKIIEYFCDEKNVHGKKVETPEDFLKEIYKKALLFAPSEEKININKYRKDFCKNIYEKIISIYKNALNQVIQKIATMESQVDKSQKEYNRKKVTYTLSILINILSVILFFVFGEQYVIPSICIIACIITSLIIHKYKKIASPKYSKELSDSSYWLIELEKDKSNYETKIAELKGKFEKLN